MTPNSPQIELLQEELRREKRARELLQQVAAAANEAPTTREVLQVAIDQICRGTGWPVGHAYLRSSQNILNPSDIWHLDKSASFEKFRKITEETPLSVGVGLPGRVLRDAKPAWIMDVQQDANFPRFHFTEDLGVRAGFAFPVQAGKQIVAVLEFFSQQAIEPDGPLLEVMANIGSTIGRIIHQNATENAVRESEMRFRSITQSAYDAIITANSDGLIISWNSGAEKIFRYSAQEAIGQPLTMLIPERFREAHQVGLRRVAVTGESRVIGKTVELAGLRKDGTEFPLELSLASWRLDQDIFYSGIIRDISERKSAEEKLRRFADELEQRVQNGISALREAERMAAYGTMVASVAHEIRHPIFAVKAAAYILKEKIQNEKDFSQQFAILDRETARMARLMDDLLEFAKPASLLLTNVEPLSLLEEAKSTFLTNHAGKTNIEISAPDDLPPLVLDRDRILQVLLNLMTNAQKHAAGLTQIHLSASRGASGFILFQVQNDGAGIRPEYASRIFEPFFTTGKGTGLGLAIVRRIVQEHGGAVDLKSDVQTGTTFSFTLPVSGPNRDPLTSVSR